MENQTHYSNLQKDYLLRLSYICYLVFTCQLEKQYFIAISETFDV